MKLQNVKALIFSGTTTFMVDWFPERCSHPWRHRPTWESPTPACHTFECHCICGAFADFKPGCHCGFHHTFSLTNYAHISCRLFPGWLSDCPLFSHQLRFPVFVRALLAGRHSPSLAAAVTLPACTVVTGNLPLWSCCSHPGICVTRSPYVNVRRKNLGRAKEWTQEPCALQGQVTAIPC